MVSGLTATTTDDVEYSIAAPDGGYTAGTACSLAIDETIVSNAVGHAVKLPTFTFTIRTVEPFTHDASIRSVSWSPDSSKIVSGSLDDTVRIWEASSGRLLRTLTGGNTSQVLSVSWSPDGRKIVSGSKDDTVRIWEASSGRLLHTLTGHTGNVLSVSWSPDGSKIVSGSDDHTVRIWEAPSGRLLSTLTGHMGNVTSVSWSPDGSKIVSGSNRPDGSKIVSGNNDDTVRIWNASTGRLLRTLTENTDSVGYTDAVRSVSWSADGSKIVSGGDDGTVRIWEASSGSLLHTLRWYRGIVWSVSWSPDNSKIVSGVAYGDHTVRIWGASSGNELRRLRRHTSHVFSVSWSPDGSKIASGGDDNMVQVWQLSSSLESESVSVALQDGSVSSTSGVWGVKLNSDIVLRFDRAVSVSGDWFTVSCDDEEIDGLTATTTSDGSVTDNVVYTIAAPPGGYSSGSECILHVDESLGDFDDFTFTIGTVQPFTHDSAVTSVSWSPDSSKIVSGSRDYTVRIWDASTEELLRTLTGHTNNVRSVSWWSSSLEDSSKIVSGGHDNTVRIWDAKTGRLVRTLTGHTDRVNSVSWSADGSMIASGSADDTVRIWEASSGRLVRTLMGHTRTVNSVSWSPDSSMIVSGSNDYTVRIWEASSGRLLRTLTGHGRWVHSVSWSQDGNRIVSGSGDHTVRIWEASSGRLLRTLTGHTGFVNSVSWSADGSKIVSGSSGPDNTVRIWEASSGRLLRTLTGHRYSVSSVSWSPDGSKVVSGGPDNTVRVWSVSPQLESVSVTLQDNSVSSRSGVVDVRLNSDIVLEFDRAVSVSEGWFTVTCDDEVIAGLTATTTSDDSATDNVVYTISAPSGGYALESACVLMIVKSQVVDAVYTSETLSSDEVFEFTITDGTVFEDRFADEDISDWIMRRLSAEFRLGSLYLEGTGTAEHPTGLLKRPVLGLVSAGDMYELSMELSNPGTTIEGMRVVLEGVSGRCNWELAPGAAAQEYKLVGSAPSARENVVVRILHTTPDGTEGVLLDNVRVRRVSDVPSGCSASTTALVSQPESVEVDAGAAARLSVAAVGTDVTYEWQHRVDNNGVWSSVSGGTTATLMLAAVSLSDGGEYQVLVRGADGVTVTSEIATVAVAGDAVFEDRFEDGDISDWFAKRLSTEFRSGSLYLAGTDNVNYNPGLLVRGPVWQSVSVGDMYELSMELSNPGTTIEGMRVVLEGVSGRCNWELAPGAAAQEYKLVGSAPSARENVVVRILHTTPDGTEGVLLDNVRVRRVTGVSSGCSPSTTALVPQTAIVSQPLSVAVEAGASVGLRVAAVGTDVTYEWQHRVDNNGVWSPLSGGTTATLMLAAVSLSDGGEYQVIVRGADGVTVTSEIATLTVTPMSRLQQAPEPMTVNDACRADVNGDGTVTILDVQAVRGRMNQREGDADYDVRYDVSEPSGVIDAADVAYVRALVGNSCDSSP